MLNRRQFICTTAALASVSRLPHALAANRDNDAIIGHGDYRYRIHRNWGQLDPDNVPIKNGHRMVIDRKGRLLLLTDHEKNNIVVYDRSGKLIEHWTLNFSDAHGLTIDEKGGEEFLYIADSRNGRVVKTDLKGRILLDIKDPRKSGIYEPHLPYRPTETAVAPNGDIYVADGYGSQWIIQYDEKGRFIRKFGGKSIREGRFLQVHGITLDNRDPDNPQLIATAQIKNAFKFFSLSGEYIRTLYLPGAYVSRAVLHDGLMYSGVSFSGDKPYGIARKSGFVMVIDENEKVVSNPGGSEPSYVDGQLETMVQTKPIFTHPHDVCVDQDTNLYIPQWNADGSYPMMLERV